MKIICYGGLINCYSRRFKKEVPYCSDSNGYWRFRNLIDVLNEAKESCLHILTHPAWWQDDILYPRQRVYRSVYGRARAIINHYDVSVEHHGRENLFGPAQALCFLRERQPHIFNLFDYLWNNREFSTLFLELWRFHEKQIINICKMELTKNWYLPINEIDSFFNRYTINNSVLKVICGVFNSSWKSISGQTAETYSDWEENKKLLVRGLNEIEISLLENGCVFLCGIIEAVSNWVENNHIGYDGIGPYENYEGKDIESNRRIKNTKTRSNIKWKELKEDLMNG